LRDFGNGDPGGQTGPPCKIVGGHPFERFNLRKGFLVDNFSQAGSGEA
jgi:hypothetical protein